jgi:hypothetical protein
MKHPVVLATVAMLLDIYVVSLMNRINNFLLYIITTFKINKITH